MKEIRTALMALLILAGLAVSVAPASAEAANYITLKMTVEGMIQTTDTFPADPWIKPMYYMVLDDNEVPNDGYYDNGWGSWSYLFRFETHNELTRLIYSDRYYPANDAVIYETSPGVWSGDYIKAWIENDGKTFVIQLPLSKIGDPGSLEISYMASHWTTTADDNLGNSPYDDGNNGWIVVSDAKKTSSFSKADAGPEDLQSDNFDIKTGEVILEALLPAITTTTPTTTTPTTTVSSPTPAEGRTISSSSASVNLHGEKTDVVLGEDILLRLSAVNLITKPKMKVQVIIIPPSGMSVTSSEFSKVAAGQFAAHYELEPGDGRDIEVRIKSNQIGDFSVNGRVIYYFGDEKDTAEDFTLNLPIKVRGVIHPGQTTISPETTETRTPGFGGLSSIFGLLIIRLMKGLRPPFL